MIIYFQSLLSNRLNIAIKEHLIKKSDQFASTQPHMYPFICALSGECLTLLILAILSYCLSLTAFSLSSRSILCTFSSPIINPVEPLNSRCVYSIISSRCFFLRVDRKLILLSIGGRFSGLISTFYAELGLAYFFSNKSIVAWD